MNSGAPVALAIGVGYLLGRTHKMRWALLLGTAAATGRLNGLSTQVLERGTEALHNSPELSKMTDSATRLLDAGKAAAVSAMSSRVESIGTKLEDRTQRLGEQGTDIASKAKGAQSESGQSGPGRSRGRAVDEDEDEDEDEGRAADIDDEYDEDDSEDAEDAEEAEDVYDEDQEGRAYDEDEDEDEDDDEDDDGSERTPSRAARRGSSGSVVRKTGR
jgi:hypothetical protein